MPKGKVKNLIGQKFGKLTVIERAENNVQGSTQWLCKCDCDGKEIIVKGGNLKSGNTQSCGCTSKYFQDLTGQKFERLTVLKRGEDYISPSGFKEIQWWCQCDCGGENSLILVSGNRLRANKTKSCGCLQKEIVSKTNKKYNTYDLSGEYGIGYTLKGEEFYFDLEDYHKIKNYYWFTDKDGYLITHLNETRIVFMHRFVMNCLDDKKVEVDHIFHNVNDNRKEFLRIATKSQNGMNKEVSKFSELIGVSFNQNNKWVAKITCNKQQIYLGSFINKDDAIKARLEAEKKYFGEFAPQKHLYEQYGIIP